MSHDPSTPESPPGPERKRLYHLGAWAASHPLKVIVVCLVLLIGAAVSANYFTSHLTGNTNVVTGSDSQHAAKLIDKKFPHAPSETDFAVVHSSTLTARDPAFHRVVDTAVTRYHGATAVAAVASPYDTPQRLISSDQHTALIPVSLNGADKELQDEAGPLQKLAAGPATDGIDVYFTGSSPLGAAGVDQGAKDLSRAESIGFPVAAIVLLIAFGSLIAAALPLVLGAVAVLAALGVLGLAALFTPFDVFVQTAVSMIGIALGIDYSLFIVTRFREEMARGGDTRHERAAAVGRTLATAGHAVIFSGTTVIVSLAGLWLVRSPKIHSMALGMTAAVIVMMVISVTLLPATLGLLGPRINRLSLPWARKSLAHPDPEHSMWARLTSVVMRRPAVIVTGAIASLAVLALPVFGLRYGVDLGAGAVKDTPAGQGYTVVSRSFASGVVSPVNVVVSRPNGPLTDAQLGAISRFTATASADHETAEVISVTGILDQRLGGHTARQLALATRSAPAALDGIVSADRTTSVITVHPRQSADTAQTARLVRDLRLGARDAFAEVHLTAYVGGGPAEIVDITDESSRSMPIVIGAVLAASWVLLLFAFRSFVLPFQAIFMNLLTSGAAFGSAVWVFQEGHGAGLFNVDRTGFIQVILPLFAFALVFGLSMDYEVFMLSRMREEWDHTRDNRQAVRQGITHTARVITAAAGIMVAVFSSFMFTRSFEITQMGFMLGLAVLIDATIVRLLFVPSLMRLVGSWNWWLPRWTGRFVPNGAAAPRRPDHLAQPEVEPNSDLMN